MASMSRNHPLLDDPEILQYVFYPRKDDRPIPSAPNATNVVVPVEGEISIGCRFYHAQERGPSILFFHGNGEIVGDYDFIAHLYAERGLNLFVADYRGYGFSGGTPTSTAMIRDAHPIFDHFLEFLEKNRHTGPVFVMGRSLGSASALELGSKHPDHLQGLIIESGFARTFDLLRSLGIPLPTPPPTEDAIFSNLQKISQILLPTLVIHAERDHIIPLQHGRDLYEACPSRNKKLVIIPGANHNDLLMVGQTQYFQAIVDWLNESIG
jgi:alpha-beta hydrolase superfamily lysophospholipase